MSSFPLSFAFTTCSLPVAHHNLAPDRRLPLCRVRAARVFRAATMNFANGNPTMHSGLGVNQRNPLLARFFTFARGLGFLLLLLPAIHLRAAVTTNSLSLDTTNSLRLD